MFNQPVISILIDGLQGICDIIIVGLCLEFVPSLCRTYDITIAALPLYSVVALRAQLTLAVESNLLY